jgi:predicted Zn finger-like uncharacterized protein
MLIQCPACHARAKLPDSKEGAKVRCGECGRVYLAVPAGQGGPRARAGGEGVNVGLIVGIGGAVVGLIVILLVRNMSGGTGTITIAKEEPPKVEEPKIDPTGWESAPVQAAAGVHRAAYAVRRSDLQTMLEPARAWAREQAALTPEGQDPPSYGEYDILPPDERAAYLFNLAESFFEGETKELVADWEPNDGQVIEETDDDATVRVAVISREGTGERRFVEWRLAKIGSRWKAYSWQRWLSPAEQQAARVRQSRDRGYEKVTLSDGSKVLEREPEPLGHLDDTPPELRTRIDKLYATMIDLNLTKEASAASRELIAIGRPAIPILLTGLYEIPLDTEAQSIQVNMIVVALRRITGQYFGYEPQELVGSGTGTTKERRESSIKQWFAWWYRNQSKFEEKETVDGLEGKIKLTEREKRLMERDN